ncbi:MAG: hypothetical protein MI974_31790 [Chitinophagales bacterium]|nr:hypothetical protein [Chitinophagales bacterium]
MTNQRNNLGDNIGRDQHNTTYQINRSKMVHTRLKELFVLFEKEEKENATIQNIIADLERLTTPATSEVKGIEQKLTEGGRLSIIDYALETKEQYNMILTKYTFFESAQKINVYLLALVKSYYMRFVYPLVCNGADDIVINEIIVEKIVNPILESLEGDTMGFTAAHIDGMIYHLTGNCHMKWTK